MDSTEILLMIGTRKGAFLASSDSQRRQWDLKGPLLKGLEVNDLTSLPSTVAGGAGPLRIYAAAKSAWWGAGIQISDDPRGIMEGATRSYSLWERARSVSRKNLGSSSRSSP